MWNVRVRDNLPKDNLPKPNLPNVKDNLPIFFDKVSLLICRILKGQFADYLAFSKNNIFGLPICPISSSAPRPLGAAYVPLLRSEVEQERRASRDGDREAIVVGAGLCDGEGERAYTVYDPILDGEKYLEYFLNLKF